MRYFGIRHAHTDMVITLISALSFRQKAKSTQKNKYIVKLRLVWLNK